MFVLLTFKNKEEPIKNEGARVFTTVYIDFVKRRKERKKRRKERKLFASARFM